MAKDNCTVKDCEECVEQLKQWQDIANYEYMDLVVSTVDNGYDVVPAAHLTVGVGPAIKFSDESAKKIQDAINAAIDYEMAKLQGK